MDPASRKVLMSAPTEARTEALSAAGRFEMVTLHYLRQIAGNRKFSLQTSRTAYTFDNGTNSSQRMPRGDAEELIRKYGAASFEIRELQKVGA